jgi:transposase
MNSAASDEYLFLSAQYHRLVPHQGKKKAIIAVPHSMLIAACYILKDQVLCKDLGADFFNRRNREATQCRCVRQLLQLGFEVQLSGKAA